MLTVFISGVQSGPNPAPGLGIARCLRDAYPDARLVAVDSDASSSGIHSTVFDDVSPELPWSEIDLPTRMRQVRSVLDSGSFWISGLDLEIAWLAESGFVGSRAFAPPLSSLRAVDKPMVRAAHTLPVRIPGSISTEAPDWELHRFCRRHGWDVWIKGPHYEARRVTDWPSLCLTRSELRETWQTDRLFLQAHIYGLEESIAYAAYRGTLLGAVRMEKRLRTEHGKTWAGRIDEPRSEFLEPLRAILAELEWTGGGEIECVRDARGRLHLIDWNPRFPAWIYGALLAGENLPARLLEAAGGGRAVSRDRVSPEFTRVVVEIPTREGHRLPRARFPDRDSRPGAGKASAPTLSDFALRPPQTHSAAPRQPPPVEEGVLAAIALESSTGGQTPRRLYLGPVARQRLAAVRRVAKASSQGRVGLSFAYSIKTNPNPRLLALAASEGLLAEAISPEEIREARRSGFRADQIVVNGPLGWQAAREPGGRPRAWFADSLAALERHVASRGPVAGVEGVRLRLPGTRSRFGVDVSVPGEFARLVELLGRLPSGANLGLHFHVASEAVGVRRWFQVCSSFLVWAEAIERCSGRSIRCLDLGGGWFPGEFETEFLSRLPGIVEDASAKLSGLEEVIVEPGKALAQPAMALLVTVTEIRDSTSGSREVVTDAAISDLPMAGEYPHRVLAPDGAGGWEPLAGGPDRLLGSVCMEQDVLASEIAFPACLREGDRLVVLDAGGYDASMAYRFAHGNQNDS